MVGRILYKIKTIYCKIFGHVGCICKKGIITKPIIYICKLCGQEFYRNNMEYTIIFYKVEDKLPEDGKDLLINDGKYICAGYYDAQKNVYYDITDYSYIYGYTEIENPVSWGYMPEVDD